MFRFVRVFVWAPYGKVFRVRVIGDILTGFMDQLFLAGQDIFLIVF